MIVYTVASIACSAVGSSVQISIAKSESFRHASPTQCKMAATSSHSEFEIPLELKLADATSPTIYTININRTILYVAECYRYDSHTRNFTSVIELMLYRFLRPRISSSCDKNINLGIFFLKIGLQFKNSRPDIASE